VIRVVVGRREVGKTTLALYMARQIRRRAIFDPRGLIRPATGKAYVVTTVPNFRQSFAELVDGDIAELIFTPAGSLPAAFDAFADEVRQFVDDMPAQPLAVLVDECSFVSSEIEEKEHPFQWVLRCSRREVVQVIVTCHRPVDVPISLRAIADQWLLFAVRQEHDLRVVRERCSSAVADAVQTLPPRHFVEWDDSVGRARRFSFPETWYVPLRDGKYTAEFAPSLSLESEFED
jgi:hypothetical protein